MSYNAGVWNFLNHLPGQNIQNRPIRYFLNVKFRLYLSTVQYWHGLMTMNFSLLTRRILEYDLCNFNIKNWSGHVYLKYEENILQGE